MERNRRAGAASGYGVILATRRQRSRNRSDEEDRMEEAIELRFENRPKKDTHGLTTSFQAASAVFLNKRKRGAIAHDSQPSGRCVGAKEATEELKADDDAEALQKHVKSRAQTKVDKFFMDFSVVPRKPRSSISLSSRFASTRRKRQDLSSTQQQSPVAGLNGSTSPYGSIPQNSRKILVSHVPAVSDQEAEVAEALFVLASSIPSLAGVLDSKHEAKLGTEAKCASSSAASQCSLGPDFASSDLKGRRPRVVSEKKEGKFSIVSSQSELVHSSVGGTELESALQRAHSLAGDSFRSETSNSKIPAGSPHRVPCLPCPMKAKTPRALEEQGDEYSGAKIIKQETEDTEMEETQPEVFISKRILTTTQNNTVDSLGNHNEALMNLHLSSRSATVHDCIGCISTLKMNLTTSSAMGKMEAFDENGGELSIKGMNADNGYLKSKDRADGRIQGSKEEFEEQREQPTLRGLQHGDVKEENHSSKPSPTNKNNDAGNSSVSSCFSSLSSTAVSRHVPHGLTGWMSGFSQLGYHGSVATSWGATSSLSMDTKPVQSAMQLPHAEPLPKMKRCATHVYVAHYIHREQEAARHSLWSAALRRATMYNLNVPPTKQLDTDRPREAYTGSTQQKAQTHQTKPSVVYSISQSSRQKMTTSGSMNGSGVGGSISASNLLASSRASLETSTVTASRHVMAAHAHYLQTKMQQNGLASFTYQVNGPPGKAAQFLNGPVFQSQLFPHLQLLDQQSTNVLLVQQQQQPKGASTSGEEARTILKSPSQSQHFQSQRQPQKLIETPASELSAHLESESKDLPLMATSGGGYSGYSGKS